MGLGCGAKLAKLCLIIFNIGFFVLGAVALGLGLFVKFDPGYLTPLLNMAPDGTIPANVNVTSLLDAGAYVLIVGGAVIFVFGFFGFCGAIKESRCLLIIYAILVFVVLSLEIAGGALAYVYRDTATAKLKSFLNDTIVNQYVGMGTTNTGSLDYDTNDAYSLGWDTLHITFECCGLDNYTDFAYAKNWKNYITYNNVNVTTKLPLTCCKLQDKSKFPSNIPNLKFVNLTECVTNPTAATANIASGCYETVKGKVTTYATIIIGVGIGVGVIEILGIVFACCLCSAIKREEDD